MDYNSKQLRFSFSSPIHPEMVFDFHLPNKDLKLLKETKIKGYSPDEVSCKRISATARDGTKIPITLTRCHSFSDKLMVITLNPCFVLGTNLCGKEDGPWPLFMFVVEERKANCGINLAQS